MCTFGDYCVGINLGCQFFHHYIISFQFSSLSCSLFMNSVSTFFNISTVGYPCFRFQYSRIRLSTVPFVGAAMQHSTYRKFLSLQFFIIHLCIHVVKILMCLQCNISLNDYWRGSLPPKTSVRLRWNCIFIKQQNRHQNFKQTKTG